MLFVVDGSFAAIRHYSTFSMNEILSDVQLPCEEAEYETGVSNFVVIVCPICIDGI